MKYKLNISFDGSSFCGWQVQENAPTIQAAMCLAAEKISGRKTSVTGCSRTDSGVHAENYVCHIELEKTLEPGKLVSAMNFYLPEQISVLSAEHAKDDFHARYNCISKEYKYLLWNSKSRNPFLIGKAFHYCGNLEVDRLKTEASFMTGRYDAASFMASGSKIVDTVREVYYFDVQRQDELITFRVCANGFLYNMVRIMVGTLIDSVCGRLCMPIDKIIESKNRKNAGFTAPAEGLYLSKINY